MTQLLHHQEPGFYGKEMQGCRWSFLQFFGLRRHRLRTNKMLSDKKHGQEKCTGGSRLRGCYAPLKDEESGVTDDHANTQVTNKHKGSKKNFGSTGLRSFIKRKLYGKEGLKEKMLPVAPRMLRTLSIHYLESNVYIFDDESAAIGGASSHGAKFSPQNATGTNLQHNTLDGSGSDMSFSRLVSRGGEQVKRKSHRSISMDGILHKVPYGQKLSGDTTVEELPRSASATYDRDGLKPYTGTAAKRYLNHDFRRSRSLSESLESYSHLLDSISSSETKRMLTSSKSTRDHSNSQLISKGVTGLAEYLVIPEDAFASHAPDKIVVDGGMRFGVDGSSCNNEVAGGSENPALIEDYSSEEKRGVMASTEADLCMDPLPLEVVDVSEKHTAATCDDEQFLSSPEINDILEEHPRTCDDDLIQSSTRTDSCTILSPLQPEDIDIPNRHMTPFDDQPSEDISIAGEDATISNDNQIQSFEDSWQKENIIHSYEADDSVGGDDLNSSSYVKESTSSSTQDNLQEDNNFGDPNDLHLQAADPQKEALLNYVKDIFSKSSFTSEALFDTWCSQNNAKLQKEDCQHSDLSFSAAAASDLAIANMSADEFLLFDLMNEALFDMYKKYAKSSGLRPKPVGRRAMKEVCDRVSHQLDEQPRCNVDVKVMMLSDLAKADRWWDFGGPGDEIGDEVAGFVLDRLVTEFALYLAKF